MIKGTNLDAETFWNKIKQIQRRPKAKTEVWAFMGGALSLKKYNEEKDKDRDSQEKQVIQLEYFLSTTQAVVNEVGAEFKLIIDRR